MTTPQEISREITGPFAEAIERHAVQTGQILWAWNFMQSQFYAIFSATVAPGNPPLALAIWHSVPSDKVQRDMAVAAAEALPVAPAVLSEVLWLRKVAANLSEYRNYPVHTGIAMGAADDSVGPLTVYPDEKSGKPRAVSRLREEPVETYWKELVEDLWVLGRYGSHLASRIRGDTSAPPLARPAVLTRTG